MFINVLEPVGSFFPLTTSFHFNGTNGMVMVTFLTGVGINVLVELELSVCPIAGLLRKKNGIPSYPHSVL